MREFGSLTGGLEALLVGVVSVAVVDIVSADDVKEEGRVELAAFERLGEVDPGVSSVYSSRRVSGRHHCPRWM